MKTCWILPQGKVPKLKDYVYARVDKENFDTMFYQYLRFPAPVCLVIRPGVPFSSLLKFVEDAEETLHIVVNSTPDPVFLSRFPRIKNEIVPTISKFSRESKLQRRLREAKTLVPGGCQ